MSDHDKSPLKEKNRVTLHVEGMTCSNCALGISRKLEHKGLKEVDVNFAAGEASFLLPKKVMLTEIVKEIDSMGYKVIELENGIAEEKTLSAIELKFYFSLIFTIPLFSHMFLPFEILGEPLVQLALCLPVLIVGMLHFGKSAIGSLKSGVPNMDVLITIGSLSAFIYSVIGSIQFYGTHEVHNYLFYETAATIITLVLLGNVLEHRSVKQTTTALKELRALQPTNANRMVTKNGQETVEIVKVADIKKGDLLKVNSGDRIPVDGIVVSGNEMTIDESMISGESLPVEKMLGDTIIGGTILLNGNLKMRAEGLGKESTLAKIIELVKNAQQDKPKIQRLGDKVSAIFVPVVLGIAALTFLLAHFAFSIGLGQSIMNSIAVLVISCPCAMGLATPTAVMAGIGRAAKNGILIKGGSTLEEFSKVKRVVFDKTGTLTTGDLKIKGINCVNRVEEQFIKEILFSLEQHSSHPIAKSVLKELNENPPVKKEFLGIKEEKGLGISAKDNDGNFYQVGSYRLASSLTKDQDHQIYIIKNGELIGTVDLEDTISNGVKETIDFLNKRGIETIILSGDNNKRCQDLANSVGVKKVYGEQLPAQKLQMIEDLSKTEKTAMVGDGINDAPALAKASVGISLGNATQIAIQSSEIILLNENDLSQLKNALLISDHTLITIKQNLFWAFFYNVIAIPIAAVGLLNPMVAALTMAFSDVIVIGNSIRLKTKKLK